MGNVVAPNEEELVEEVEGTDPVDDEFEGVAEHPSETYLEDNLEDRQEDHEYKDRKIKVLCGNGWFTGDILYFNVKLEEFKVKFKDGTFDYLKKEDFDGIEVIIV